VIKDVTNKRKVQLILELATDLNEDEIGEVLKGLGGRLATDAIMREFTDAYHRQEPVVLPHSNS
jgi:hypothetical protein